MFKSFLNLFKKKPHVHTWKAFPDQKHFWYKHPDGSVTGMYNPIESLIELRCPTGRVPDPKSFEKLLWWKSLGFTAVHTSWHVFGCKCGAKWREEFYEEPFKINISPEARTRELTAINAVVRTVV